MPTALALTMGTPRSGGDARTAALTQTGLAAVPPLALQGPPESGCTPGPPTCAPAGVLLKCPPGAQPDSQHCPSPSRRRLCWATCHGSRPSGLSAPGSLKWPPAPAPLSSPGQTGPQAQRRLSVVSCPRRPWTGHLQSLDPHLPQGPEICPPARATHSGDRVGGRGGRRPGQSAGPPGSEGKKGLVQEAAARTIPPRVRDGRQLGLPCPDPSSRPVEGSQDGFLLKAASAASPQPLHSLDCSLSLRWASCMPPELWLAASTGPAAFLQGPPGSPRSSIRRPRHAPTL